jgi:hypothetical protein
MGIGGAISFAIITVDAARSSDHEAPAWWVFMGLIGANMWTPGMAYAGDRVTMRTHIGWLGKNMRFANSLAALLTAILAAGLGADGQPVVSVSLWACWVSAGVLILRSLAYGPHRLVYNFGSASTAKCIIWWRRRVARGLQEHLRGSIL